MSSACALVYNWSPQETETWCPLFTQSHVTHGEKWGETPKRSMHVLNRRVFETDDIVSMSRELSRGTFPRACRRSGAAISHGAASSATPRRPPRPSLARGCLAAPTRPQRVRVAAKRGGRGEGGGGEGRARWAAPAAVLLGPRADREGARVDRDALGAVLGLVDADQPADSVSWTCELDV